MGNSADMPVLTVITVVFNDVANIRRTLLSVLHQTWGRIQYIVIDGASEDGTLGEIYEFQDKIDTVISEKDEGIYYAMNKGLTLASGDYVVFMNSGDEFYAPDTVEKVFASARGADIYYGETEMLDGNLRSLGRRRHRSPAKLSHSSFRFGMSVSHQAIIVAREIAGTFDTKYKLSADIDWILNAINRAGKIVNPRMYIAKYLTGGISKKRHRESLAERFGIFSKHYGLLSNLLNHVIIAFKLAGYYVLNRRTND
jgi:glycosyltransferase involved in cell wall biosynthesis